MSSNNDKIREAARKLQQSCNDYEQTVQALKAVAHELCWREDTKCLDVQSATTLGRRLHTSRDNRISPDADVTPDLVVSRARSGTIAEAKIALSNRPELREERLISLQKYDDDLIGWKTSDGKIDQHGIILIVQYARAFEVKKQLEELLKTNQVRWTRPFGIMSFAVMEQVQTFLAIHLVAGSMVDRAKQEKLENPVSLRLDHVAANPRFANVQMYDHCPPMPLLMDLVQRCVLASMSGEQIDTMKDEGQVRIVMTIEELQRAMADQFGPALGEDRSPEIPQKAWLFEAVERFIDMGWASWLPGASGKCAFVIKQRRKPFEQFLNLIAEIEVASSEQVRIEAERASREPLLFQDDLFGGRGKPDRKPGG